MGDACILGGGVTGLACAWKLSERTGAMVFEKSKGVGGISSCFKYKDMKLDYGPHKIYTQDRKLLGEVLSLFSPEEVLTIEKKSRVMLGGHLYSFPVRLPELLLNLNPGTTAGIGFSYLSTMLFGHRREGSYEDYIRSRFGHGLYDLVFSPMASKVWGNPSELSDELARTRVAMPHLMDLVKRTLLGDRGKPEISAKFFHYPKWGIDEVSNKMQKKAVGNKGKVALGSEVNEIRVSKGKAEAVKAKGKRFPCSHLVSTIPIEEAVNLIKPEAPEDVLKAGDRLTYRNLILAVLVIKKPRIFHDNWLFFPEKKYVFNRVYEQKGFSPFMVPETKTALCCEITCEPDGEMWGKTDREIADIASEELESTGLIKRNDVIDSTVARVEKAYPIYKSGYRKNLDKILEYVDGVENAYFVGRNGMFNYVGLMDCIDMGINTAEHIVRNGSREEWVRLRKRFHEYVTVD